LEKPNSDRPVLIIGTLDTKGEELLFLRDCLAGAGVRTRVVDVGVLGEPRFEAEVTRDEIARCAGESAAALRDADDRGRAVAAMHRGLAAWLRALPPDQAPAGAIATAGMRELPIGLPKLMVSTMASGDVRMWAQPPGGAIGAKTALTLDQCVARIQAIHDAAVAVRAEILVLCHGGPIADPEDAAYVLARTRGVAGFFGASSVGRLPTEIAITAQVKRFKSIPAGA
jgi:hypothetical protein